MNLVAMVQVPTSFGWAAAASGVVAAAVAGTAGRQWIAIRRRHEHVADLHAAVVHDQVLTGAMVDEINRHRPRGIRWFETLSDHPRWSDRVRYLNQRGL